MKSREVRLGALFATATALLFSANITAAGEGISKADKYFEKAAQYEAQGDFEKAAKYLAKGEKYSGASEYATKAEKYAAKAARYAEAGDLYKAQKYAAKALKYADGEGNSKAARYAAKAERYALEGDLEKAAKYAAKAEKYAEKEGSSCWPAVSADFAADGYSVSVTSTKELSNVVLLFEDGTTQRHENLEGAEQIFGATGVYAGKILTGAWIKSGCNHSEDGPGYGEFIEASSQTTGLPVISVTAPPATLEGNDGVLTEAMFTISLSEMVPLDGSPVSVTLSTVDGSATADTDYYYEEAVLTFLPGEQSMQFPVLVIGDHVPEEREESYAVQLVAPVNALLGQAYAEGLIIDDEGEF